MRYIEPDELASVAIRGERGSYNDKVELTTRVDECSNPG